MNLDQRAPVGVAVLVRPLGAVLLGRRKGAHGAGEWAAPGGKPKPGEPPAEAAARELEEETGIVADPVMLAPVPYWQYDRFEGDGIHYVTIYFDLALAPNDRPSVSLLEPNKCEGWEYVNDVLLPHPHWGGLPNAIHAAKLQNLMNDVEMLR